MSGREKSARGCLLELTTGGRDRIALPGGETRAFLEDGEGQLWIGTEGDGLKRYDPRSGRFTYYLKPLLGR